MKDIQGDGRADGPNDAEARRTALLDGIACGEKAIEDGRVVSHAEARRRMARWVDGTQEHSTQRTQRRAEKRRQERSR